MQLMELNVPMVLALNMMDEVRGNGGSIRINEMESLLGIPVIPISAAKNEGVDELNRMLETELSTPQKLSGISFADSLDEIREILS